MELPDVAVTARPDCARALRWVGMDGIDLPLRADGERIAANADVAVDLPRPDAKGIHMSRLYRALGALADTPVPGPTRLVAMLRGMIASHADCQASAARVRMRFKRLRARDALVTPGLHGWHAYPVTLQAEVNAQGVQVSVSVDVTYSSTCPCSAALSRQLLAEAFLREAEARSVFNAADAAAWLAEYGSVATPHSQRSIATVTLVLDSDADFVDIDALIDRVESSLGTATQTAVKRADEQAFARRNGQNLMYVEDATRRILAALGGMAGGRKIRVSVRHLESLHPHDAVATGEG